MELSATLNHVVLPVCCLHLVSTLAVRYFAKYLVCDIDMVKFNVHCTHGGLCCALNSEMSRLPPRMAVFLCESTGENFTHHA